jgi:hypothetical protein
MSRCASGFPGCALADDLLSGQDEGFRALAIRARELAGFIATAAALDPQKDERAELTILYELIRAAQTLIEKP